MGIWQSKYNEIESEERQEIIFKVKEKGVAGAQELMREKSEEQRQIKIGVAGVSGVGKSSFINAIRGINGEDENAAKTDVVEVIAPEPTLYNFPDHPNIKIVDLPAFGTPSCPNLEMFYDKVRLETYDVFFVLTDKRLTVLEAEFARKIKSLGKMFFLIRTKIDQDELSEKRQKNCDINAMLKKIRAYLYESAKDLEIREDEIFLISNHYTDKWDFKRLSEATTKWLPASQKTQLLLTLSKDVVLEKVKVLRGAINFWLLFRSIIVKLFTTTKYSRNHEYKRIVEKVQFYKSDLGFPIKNSESFKEMNPELQNKVQRFHLTDQMNVASWLRELKAERGYKHVAGDSKGSSHENVWNETLPWLFAKDSLHLVLDEMEETAMEILQFSARGNDGPM